MPVNQVMDLVEIDIPTKNESARLACASPSSLEGVHTFVATIACSRRPRSVSPNTRSAWPYMGEESKKLAPTCSALSTTARAFCSAVVPCTSKVCQVPIPITGTFNPLFPKARYSIVFSFVIIVRFLVTYQSYHAKPCLIAPETGRRIRLAETRNQNQ